MFDMISFTVFSVFALFTSLISLAVFLLNGYAFYKISKLRFLPYPWFTFIPFLSLYMQGLIADSLKYRHPKSPWPTPCPLPPLSTTLPGLSL